MELNISLLALAMRVFIVILLYAFIFWALVGIRSNEPKTARPIAESKRKNGILISHASGNSQRFSPPQITIGRHPSCDFVLNDKSISLRHARISYKDGKWWLTDLKSKNGSYLNSERINDRRLLAENDQIKLGSESFVIYWD